LALLLLAACGEEAPEPATVIVGTNLRDATLFIDGRSAGPLRDERPVQLLPGAHTLEARQGTQVLARSEPQIAAGQTTRIRLDGTSPPPSSPSSPSSPSPATGAMQPNPAGEAPTSAKPPAASPASAGGTEGAARLTLGDPDVRGSLNARVVARVVNRHRSELVACAERERGVRGRAVLSFVIGPSGAVQSSTVGQSTLRSAPLERCLAHAARRWTFPSPSGGGVVGVNLPLELVSA
jgi:TonB family protein